MKIRKYMPLDCRCLTELSTAICDELDVDRQKSY